MKFTDEPYNMVDQYLDLCDNGGLVVPLYLTEHDRSVFQQAADIKGLTLIEYLDSLGPEIMKRVDELVYDYRDQEMNV